jgi:hypothetical protein
MELRMSTALCLEYPNGRTHRLEVPEEIRPGQEFDLYGHRWKVVGRVAARTWIDADSQPAARPLLCRQTAG